MRRLGILLALAALTFAACGGGGGDSDAGGDAPSDGPPVSVSAPDAAHGEELFMGTCAACHGTDAMGLEGLGKDLTNSTFADGLDDVGLVSFIIEGRPAGDPLNTTGVDMLPRGGNNAFTDQDLFDIVAYLRTL